MTNRITHQATALVFATMVTLSVFAALDVLAAIDGGAVQALVAQRVTGQPG